MIKTKCYSAKEISQILSYSPSFDDFFIDTITINSKEKTEKNACFFAINGKKFNGHNYINEAIKNGAKLIVASERIDANVPVIYVNDTIKALGKLAQHNKGKTKVVGITGSVGKTTTKDMIASVLKEKYSVISTEGNLNNEIGVPLTLLKIKNENFAVIEMGMRARGEIDYLASISRPETAIITNSLSSHIERLKTRNNIFLAKKEILNYFPKYAVLPNDERFKCLDLQGVTMFFVGEQDSAYISDYEYTSDGIIFSVNKNNKIKLNTFFRHNLDNALFAYIVGKIYKLNDTEIKNGLEKFKSTQMHEQYLNLKGITVINDCYNASFESVKSAIYALKEYCKINNKRMNVLLADILEAGDESEKIHFEIGRLCKNEGVYHMYAYGKYASSLISGFDGGFCFENKQEISRTILRELNSKDVILIKASRNMHLEEIIEDMKENE